MKQGIAKRDTGSGWTEGHEHDFHPEDQSLCPVWNQAPPLIS